jgi:hypothetical protein
MPRRSVSARRLKRSPSSRRSNRKSWRVKANRSLTQVMRRRLTSTTQNRSLTRVLQAASAICLSNLSRRASTTTRSTRLPAAKMKASSLLDACPPSAQPASKMSPNPEPSKLNPQLPSQALLATKAVHQRSCDESIEVGRFWVF